jgi:DNA-binding NarL/FixJ family response regulator
MTSTPNTPAKTPPAGLSPLSLEDACVLVADDHPLVRGALRQAVAQCLSSARVLEADTVDGARQKLSEQPGIDLLLLDLHMPDAHGFAGLFAIRAEFPSIPVIVVSATEDTQTMRRAIDYGAAGFVPKSTPVGDIAIAIRAVLAGDVWMPAVARQANPAPEDADFADRMAALTPQQLRVLVAITQGKLNKQIAYELSVSEATVKAHVTAILRKLGVVSRTQAVIAASRLAVNDGQPMRSSA